MIVFFFSIPDTVKGTHIYGGDLTYTYLGNNLYNVRLFVYRDCGPTNVNGTDFDPFVSIGVFNANGTLYTELQIDLLSSDVEELSSDLANPCFTVPPNVCVEKALYEQTVELPFNAQGYTLTYQRCCRNTSIDNLVQSQNNLAGMTLTTNVPGTNLVSTQNNSPSFVSLPPTSLCLNAPFFYSAEAIDPDGDLLVYSFCTPLDGADQNMPAPTPPSPPPYSNNTWSAGFSASNPITSNPAFSINSSTGYITGTATQLGTYAIAICVEEYRNGVLINTIRRDYQLNVNLCDPNTSAGLGISGIGGVQTDFCLGLAVDFENNSVNADTYHWDFGVANTNSDTSNVFAPSFTYQDPGTYTVTLISNPGWSCADTATIDYTAIETFIPNISNPISSCLNGQVVYDFDHGLGFNVLPSDVIFNWTFGTGSSPAQSNLAFPNDIYLDENQSSYSVTLSIDNDGCVGTQTFDFTPLPQPEVSINPITDPCAGLNVSLSQTSTNTTNYLWNFGLSGTNATSNLPNPSFFFPSEGNYWITLVGSSNGTCADTSTLLLQVYADLSPAFTSPGPVCFEGHNLTFQAEGYTTSSPNITWDFGNDANIMSSSNMNVSGVQFNQPGTYPVSLTIAENGCTETITQDVWVVTDPTIDWQFLPEDACAGSYIRFYANAESETPMYFEWTVGGQTFNEENPNLFCENPGVYSAALHAFTLTGCVTDLNVYTDSAFVIHPAPAPGFTISPDEISIDNPSISIADSSSGATTCVYFISDGGVIEAFDGQHTFTEFGQQSIIQVLENEYGCKSSATAYVDIGGTIVFVPNSFTPDGDGVNDAWRPEMIGVTEYHLDIYNRWGVKIFESDDPTEFWMGNVDRGKYYVENGSYEYRIIFKDQLYKPKAIKGNIVVMR